MKKYTIASKYRSPLAADVGLALLSSAAMAAAPPTIVGKPDAASRVNFEVALPLRNSEQLDQLLAALHDPVFALKQIYWLRTKGYRTGAFQVARMDNDPSLPDHGRLTLCMQGGR